MSELTEGISEWTDAPSRSFGRNKFVIKFLVSTANITRYDSITAVPWNCPNCWYPLTHRPTELAPQIHKIYRCPICKVDLVFDPQKRELVFAPFEPDTPQDKKTA